MQHNNLNPHVSVDCVIFGFDGDGLHILLIERKQNEKQALALPGDLILDDEDLDAAAVRVLSELTHVKGIGLRQFHSFGDPARITKPEDIDWLSKVRNRPMERVITVGYYALTLMENVKPSPDSFAEKIVWHPLYEEVNLAFDHNLIVETAVKRLRSELKAYPLGFELLPNQFTFRELKSLYEAILNRKLDKRNFYKKIQGSGLLIQTGEKEKNVAHKPAKLYSLNRKKFNQIKNSIQLW